MQQTVELPIEVARIIPFERIEGSNGLASVLVRVGPLSVWCRLSTNANGEPFLSMPARKGRDEKYHETVYFTDRRQHELAQKMAIEAFQARAVSLN